MTEVGVLPSYTLDRFRFRDNHVDVDESLLEMNPLHGFRLVFIYFELNKVRLESDAGTNPSHLPATFLWLYRAPKGGNAAHKMPWLVSQLRRYMEKQWNG